MFSRVRRFATPWTVARQAPLSVGFSRQEHWSGLPFPFPGDLPDPGIEAASPAVQADSLLWEPHLQTVFHTGCTTLHFHNSGQAFQLLHLSQLSSILAAPFYISTTVGKPSNFSTSCPVLVMVPPLVLGPPRIGTPRLPKSLGRGSPGCTGSAKLGLNPLRLVKSTVDEPADMEGQPYFLFVFFLKKSLPS